MIRRQYIGRRKLECFDHCLSIQTRRVEAGKRGYAKAVRRWLKKWDHQYELKQDLPVTWG